MGKKVTRLFEQFKPRHYVVDLQPDRDTMTFSGSVVVSGQKVGRPSHRITFHQKDLTPTSVKVIKHDKKGDTEVAIDRINRHNGFNELRLHAKDKLFPGQFTVKIEFTGKITRPMSGMYPCFFEHKGVSKKLIATQFESHYAREVFPCIDEPEAKATFDLILTTPKGETVLSNTPLKEVAFLNAQPSSAGNKNKGLNMQRTVFETTPRMPTYLLAFIYGEVGCLSAKTKSGVTVRTYATPDNVALTEFALDVAVKCIEFYNEYFGIEYPLAKCDLIALPDFASGAMENWGCITFREQTLLVDPQNTSLPTKQHVAMVVAHELAHQWFGNLVTMRWWTDLWLNEGFASWIEYLAVDSLFPEWEMWTQFIVDEQQIAMKLDALEHTHPIEVPVNHPDEIHSIFDTISYGKGASVIHMLHQYLGADTFRDGLRYYLKKHEYQNTDTIDLWSAFEEVSDKPVMKFMNTWTTQGGYPIMRAEVDNDTLALTQQRFNLNPAARQNRSDTGLKWPVPLLSQSNQIPDIFYDASNSYSLKETVLKLNRGQSGFYRSTYNASHLFRLGELVKRGQLEPLDRLGLLSDAFESAKAGYASTVEALSFMGFYSNEDNSAVWDIMAANLGSIRSIMDDESLRDDMKPYLRKLSAKQLKRLGWAEVADESHFDKLLRPTILSLASIGEEESVVNEALKRFAKMQKPEDIHPDLRGIVYATSVRHGGKDEFEKLLAMHNASSLSEERVTIAAAITGFKQLTYIKRALDQINSDNVRLQDVSYWLAYSFMNRHARMATWDWMIANWEWLAKNLGSDMSFSRFPLYAARSFSDINFLPVYKEFFESIMSPVFERSVKQGIETIEWQSAWKHRDFKLIKAFFLNPDSDDQH